MKKNPKISFICWYKACT